MMSRSRTVVNLCIVFVAAAMSACRSTTAPSAGDAATRQTVLAEALNREASAKMHKDPARAEELFRKALQADLFYGPAHNNLGVLFLEQDRLYEAASEFEWARKLMPGHPDPRINLALTLERAGRVEDALQTYKTAIEVHPEHIAAMQGLVRLQLRTGKADEETRDRLATIALQGEDQTWREWAKLELMRRGEAPSTR